MQGSRKQVIAKILMMEKKLNHHQVEVREEKSYLKRVIHNNMVTLLVTLLPAFTVGWGLAQLGSKKLILKQLVNFGMLTLLNRLKKRMIHFH